MTPFKSFEEVYQNAYSHGLEQIYKLENVDIRSVRKIEPRQESVKKAAIIEQYDEDFDLGEGHRLWLSPSVFEEPIEVLELHRQPEKLLKEQGIVNLKHLYEADLTQFIYSKGMGQGHIDEISSKLNNYLSGKAIRRQYHIDFSSWLISILAPLTRKESYLLLEEYRVGHSIVLTPMDLMDVKKMGKESRSAVIKEAKEKVLLEKHKIIKRFREIESAFIKPWVLGRLGIASRDEVEERLKRKSQEIDLKKWQFITTLVPEIEIPELYYATPQIEADFLILEKAIRSFIWNDRAVYPLPDLHRLVSEKLSHSFRSLESIKLLKFLETSPAFSLVNENGNILVSIA